MNRRIGGVLIGSLACLALVARAETQPAPAPNPPTLAAIPDADSFYDPSGRRDPFRPPQAREYAAADGSQAPLQRYELGQLKLVAVIYDTVAPRAVVEDEAGLGYIVKIGTQIGINGGKVRAIERGRVLVEEESVDFFGEPRLSEVILEMASGERGSR